MKISSDFYHGGILSGIITVIAESNQIYQKLLPFNLLFHVCDKVSNSEFDTEVTPIHF